MGDSSHRESGTGRGGRRGLRGGGGHRHARARSDRGGVRRLLGGPGAVSNASRQRRSSSVNRLAALELAPPDGARRKAPGPGRGTAIGEGERPVSPVAARGVWMRFATAVLALMLGLAGCSSTSAPASPSSTAAVAPPTASTMPGAPSSPDASVDGTPTAVPDLAIQFRESWAPTSTGPRW